jgi:fibronectin-binding autotransporter adhesin
VPTVFGNIPPDAPVAIDVDDAANLGLVHFSNTGNRTYTFSGSAISFTTDGSTRRLQTTGSAQVGAITFNNNLIFGASSGTATLSLGHSIASASQFSTITINGNILTDGAESGRTLAIYNIPTLILNGSNQAIQVTFGETGEVVANNISALGAGGVQKVGVGTLSLRSDLQVNGAWTGTTTALTKLRISETTASSADRILTMVNRLGGDGTFEWVDNINSTGRLILNLQYSGGNIQTMNLITNDSAIVRFSQSGNTTYSGPISGSGELQKTGLGTTTLSGANTYTGDTVISAGTLLLSNTGKLNFLIGADGESNQITGTSSGFLTLNGTFTFDLSGAGTNVGDSWLLIDFASLGGVTYGATFAVEGFTKIEGIWTNGSYTFDQSTGVLTATIPEPSTVCLGVAGLVALSLRARARRAEKWLS